MHLASMALNAISDIVIDVFGDPDVVVALVAVVGFVFGSVVGFVGVVGAVGVVPVDGVVPSPGTFSLQRSVSQ